MVRVTRPIWLAKLLRLNYLIIPCIGLLAFEWWYGILGLFVAYLIDIPWTKWAYLLSWDDIHAALDTMYHKSKSGSYIHLDVGGRKLRIVKGYDRDKAHVVIGVRMNDWPELTCNWKQDNTLDNRVIASDIDDSKDVRWLCMDAQPSTEGRIELLKYMLNTVDATLSSDVYAKDMVVPKINWEK